MKKTLEYVLIASVFLITILPLLVFNGLFFPFITSKAFVFRILVEVGVLALALLATIDRKYIPRITPVTIFFFVFVGVMLLADLLGANVVRSIWSNFERMEGWVTLVHLFGLFLLFDRVLFMKDMWKRWLQASLLVSFFVGVHGVMQLLGYTEIHQGGVRVDANFGNATYLAVYTLFHIFFAAWLFFSSKNLWWRGAYVCIGTLNLILLYFSGTRGALLGLLGGVVIGLLVYAITTKSKRLLAGGIGFLLLCLCSFGVLSVYKDTPFIQNDPVLARVASISLEAGETRFQIWNIALQGFYERPLFGWGQGNFNLIFSKYYDPSLYDQEPWFDRAHNVFFDWLVAGGIFGLGAYLLLFGSLFLFLFRGNFTALEKGIGIGLLSAYAINNLFVFDNLLSYIPFVFVIAFVSSRVHREYTVPPFRAGALTQSILVIVALYAMYVVNIPALNANGALIRAVGPQYSLEERQQFFTEALSYNSFANQEIREQMVQLALMAVRQEGVSTEAKVSLLVNAAKEMEVQAMLMPESARIHMLFGITLRVLGQHEIAYQVLSRARELAPRKQSVLLEFAAAAEAVGKKEEALNLFKEVYESDISYSDAEVFYEEAKERLAK